MFKYDYDILFNSTAVEHQIGNHDVYDNNFKTIKILNILNNLTTFFFVIIHIIIYIFLYTA